MKKLLFVIILFCILQSCTDVISRQTALQSYYPQNIVTPATNLLSSQGYEFLMEDTINHQIYAVSFYEFSNSKIKSIRNIK